MRSTLAPENGGSTTEALSLAEIDAFYADSHVLHAVSFKLRIGRVLALLGRNGAGKTTCMNAVIGFLPARRGAIRLFGENISRLSPEAISHRGIGLVPQGRRVFPTLTVRENLIVARQSRAGGNGRWPRQGESHLAGARRTGVVVPLSETYCTVREAASISNAVARNRRDMATSVIIGQRHAKP